MEQILSKFLSAVSDPVNIILLLWIWYFIKERSELIDINTKLLDAQQARGETLSRIQQMIDELLRNNNGRRQE